MGFSGPLLVENVSYIDSIWQTGTEGLGDEAEHVCLRNGSPSQTGRAVQTTWIHLRGRIFPVHTFACPGQDVSFLLLSLPLRVSCPLSCISHNQVLPSPQRLPSPPSAAPSTLAVCTSPASAKNNNIGRHDPPTLRAFLSLLLDFVCHLSCPISRRLPHFSSLFSHLSPPDATAPTGDPQQITRSRRRPSQHNGRPSARPHSFFGPLFHSISRAPYGSPPR